MWFLIRLLALAIGAIVRWRHREIKAVPNYPSGNPVGIFETSTKGRKTVSTRLGFPCRSPIVFKITEERSVDRFFKTLGIAVEIQSGDEEFDQNVYIACDHPRFAGLINNKPEFRSNVHKLLYAGYDSIVCDGQTLFASSKTIREPSREYLELLASMANDVVGLGSSFSIFKDRIAGRVLLVEAIIWSLAAYAIGSYAEYAVTTGDVYVNSRQLVTVGCAVALVLAVGLMFACVVFIGRSSRTHRVIVESFLVLLLFLPVVGVRAVSDVNRELDQAAPQEITRVVTNTREEVRRRRRGPSRTYHLRFDSLKLENGLQLQDEVEVTHDVYRSAPVGKVVSFQLSPGYLGLPWYREITAGQSKPPAP